MDMNKLFKEMVSIERKNSVRVEIYDDYFLFTNLKTLRETRLDNYAVEDITNGKANKQSAQAVISYAKRFL